MLVHEGPSAQEAQLLGVREDDDQIVPERRTGLQGPDRLEGRDHTRTIVASTDSAFPAVVMSRDQHPARRRSSRNSGYDISYRRSACPRL